MDKPSKLNERLTRIANLSVVVGIIFLAVELNQNTQAIQAQTRDSLTEKQMTYMGWVATNPELARVVATGYPTGVSQLATGDSQMLIFLLNGIFREWENSHYQYEQGLFTTAEFEARLDRWRMNMALPGYQEEWAQTRTGYSPSFRAEIDRIVAEVGGY